MTTIATSLEHVNLETDASKITITSSTYDTAETDVGDIHVHDEEVKKI